VAEILETWSREEFPSVIWFQWKEHVPPQEFTATWVRCVVTV